MRVMVTGATAPLGTALVEHLLAADGVTCILAVGREATSPWRDRRIQYRAVDLGRPRELHDVIHGAARDHAIDTVVHAAQHRCPHDGGPRIHAQNVEAARGLVLECADHPTIRRLVYRSFAEVYAQHHATTSLIDEEAPLEFAPTMPQWLRDRVEADLTVCAHRGATLEVTVLRCAELLAPGTGSQLWDYLSSRVCMRPAGFDPIINVLAMEDAVAAFTAAIRSASSGIFNIVGSDTLPLSRAIAESHRLNVPVPGAIMSPLYKLRRAIAGSEFRYDLNVQRFHFGGVLDGARARRELNYIPLARVRWPQPWWHALVRRLAENGA